MIFMDIGDTLLYRGSKNPAGQVFPGPNVNVPSSVNSAFLPFSITIMNTHWVEPSPYLSVLVDRHVPSNRRAALESDDASAFCDVAGFDFGSVDLAGVGVGVDSSTIGAGKRCGAIKSSATVIKRVSLRFIESCSVFAKNLRMPVERLSKIGY
jgi:hypothetical protein